MNHNFGIIQPHDVYRTYKSMFHRNLAPFFQMVSGLRSEMETDKWIVMTNNISARVIANPEQYLSKDMPRPEITTILVREIFDEFLLESVGSDILKKCIKGL